MKKEKAWVWFKGGLKGGSWIGGFIASSSEEGGIVIEHSDFRTCRVPSWRVIFKEPEDKSKGPSMPEGSNWKYD